ncbi:TPA: hypothetical protein ACH3X3_010098 [Trebouxia sp. C0006]
MGEEDIESDADDTPACSTSYGGGFAAGFAMFQGSGEFSDVCVVFHGQEHPLHSLILGYHSEFFRRAFSSGMRESTQRRVELTYFHKAYTQTAEGLPPETIEAILTHKELQVQCEAQVLLFVLDYVDSTQLEPAVAAQLFHHVRLAYLSNERLVWLQQQAHSLLPAVLLLQGCLQRLQMQDQP